ncbi:glutamate-cysteine ligase family protein [Actinoallomurus rhizosphaericola]|uniref:glutamate-cysteine ligase family protein n=1 Tax=Actinoallomurus rhizosphaericola TaxID=2952536 RepID=UPI0020906F88|nr:glutamate-cysteine ligase family protein [Actinoallomurus rhizosphaericola]MCO5991876.1 glutamate-cysteine ligase family protein [Actinoallomurus rhizosphaericola]
MSRLTIDEVYEHVNGVCFKTGPPGLVGIETEWFVIDRNTPSRSVPVSRVRAVMEAAGPPPAGSRVTYEPGGQLELSSPPRRGPAAAHAAIARDIAHVTAHLAKEDLCLDGRGADLRPTVFQATAERYRRMREYFGDHGLRMMCGTASLQVCLDIGADGADAARRWRLAHALGPVLAAAFANSPGPSVRSRRQVVWETLDPGRTAAVGGDDPVEAWVRYALDAQVMLIRDGWRAAPGLTFREWMATGRPDLGDLAYHLSTLFPPVRPQGWLELRMIDALPPPYWPVPVAVAAALLDDPVAADLAAEAAEPARDRWRQAARDALTDPVLARAARRCFAAALDALPRLGGDALVPLVDAYAGRFVERGRCPADERPGHVPMPPRPEMFTAVPDAGSPATATEEEPTWT